MQYHDTVRLKHTHDIVGGLLNDLADRVSGRVRIAPKEAMQSGDDTVHRDLWEEFKDQVKGQQSTSFQLYEDKIRLDCESELESLPEYLRELIWLWSESFLDRESYPGDATSHMSMDDLVDTLYRRICERADAEDMLFDEFRIEDLIPEANWEGFSGVDLEEIDPISLVSHMPDVIRFMQGDAEYGDGVALTIAEDYLTAIEERDGVEFDESEYRERAEDLASVFLGFLKEWRRRVLATPPKPE